MSRTDEGAQGNLRAFILWSDAQRTILAHLAAGCTVVAMPSRIAPACLLLALFVSACSGANDADSDILAEWRTDTSKDAAAAPATTVLPLPELPEGMDSLLEENYQIAAIRNYLLVKQAAAGLIAVASEFDLGSTVWLEDLKTHIADVRKSVANFEQLNPPAEFLEQDQKIVESMQHIVTLTETFEEAIDALDFRKGADALSGLQAETNVLVSHGRFPEIAMSDSSVGSPTTSLP